MGKAVIISDLHMHLWSECSNDSGYDRLADGQLVLRQSLELASQHDAAWVLLGDIKHATDRWYVAVLNALLAELVQYKEVRKYILPGQHDGFVLDQTGLEALRPYATIIESPTIMAPYFCADQPVLWYPHSRDLADLPEWLTKAKQLKAKGVFGHNFLSGVLLGPQDVRRPDQGVPLEAFGLAGKGRIFDWGFFGDIHKRQFCTLRNKLEVTRRETVACTSRYRWDTANPGRVAWATVSYPGSPYPQNWGELETDKGCLLVDFGARTIDVVQLEAPRYRYIDLSQPDGTNQSIERLIGLVDRGKASYQGDFVKMLVGPWADGKLCQQLRDICAPRWWRTVVIRQPQPRRAGIRLDTSMSREKLVEQYVKARPLEGFSDKDLATAGKKLLSRKEENNAA